MISKRVLGFGYALWLAGFVWGFNYGFTNDYAWGSGYLIGVTLVFIFFAIRLDADHAKVEGDEK